MSTLTISQFDLNQIIIEETKRLLEEKSFVKRSTRSVVSEISDRYERTPVVRPYTLPAKGPDVLLDVLQATLGLAGLFQGPWELADLMNAAISFGRGQCFEATLDIISALPIGGAISAATLGAYRAAKIAGKTGQFSTVLKAYMGMVTNFLKYKNEILESADKVSQLLINVPKVIAPIARRGDITNKIFRKKIVDNPRLIPKEVREEIQDYVNTASRKDPGLSTAQLQGLMDKKKEEYADKILTRRSQGEGIESEEVREMYVAARQEANRRLRQKIGPLSAYDSEEALTRDVEILFGIKGGEIARGGPGLGLSKVTNPETGKISSQLTPIASRVTQSLGPRIGAPMALAARVSSIVVQVINFFYKAMPFLSNFISGMAKNIDFLYRAGADAVKFVADLNKALNEGFCKLSMAPLTAFADLYKKSFNNQNDDVVDLGPTPSMLPKPPKRGTGQGQPASQTGTSTADAEEVELDSI